MAEFVSPKENQRRMAALIVCILIDTIALAVGIFAIKGAGDLEKAEKVDSVPYLREEIRKLRDETAIMERNFHTFSHPIGWRTSPRGSDDPYTTTGVNGEALKTYLNFWLERLEQPGFDVREFRRWGPEGQGSPFFLTTLFDKVQEKELHYRGLNAQLDAAIKKAVEDAKTTDTEIARAEEENSARIKKGVEELKANYKDLAGKERQHAEELENLKADLVKHQTELTDLKNRNVKEMARQEARLSELTTRMNWLLHRREEAKERKEPDGTILSIDETDGLVYVDLVHADRIFKGTRFKVYSLEKGGVKLDKGEIEVAEVRREGSSKAAIVKVSKADDPLRVGDRIYNEFFERGKARRIAFAGRLTGTLSNEEASRKIRDFGDLYQDKVDETTNYVVVGEGYAGPDGQFGDEKTSADDHPNFRLAQELGVKILLERHLYEYLGVPQ